MMRTLLAITLWLVCSSARSITLQPLPKVLRYEAEAAFVSSGDTTKLFTCEEKSWAASMRPQSTLIFTLNIPHDGEYPVSFTYAACAQAAEGVSVSVYSNGLWQLEDTLENLGASEWSTKVHTITLRAGLNTISYKIGDSAGLSVDHITVKGAEELNVRGATQSYYEIEAEASTYVGTLIGPDRLYTHLPSEASGRKAVQIQKESDHVDFKMSGAAGGIVIRYSIPDTSTGSGQSTLLDVLIGGTLFQTVNITSLYSWVYGSYPFSKRPGDGNPHHFYDDIRISLGKTIPAGTVLRLQPHSGNNIVITIDLVDFYTIPAPYTRPSGYLSVADYGADPSGSKDNFTPFSSAINAASSQGKGLWIPIGKYTFSKQIENVNKVVIRGAGPWYSELHGYDFGFLGGFAPNSGSSGVQLFDFAVFGQTRTRVDSEQSTAVGGSLSNSHVQNLWIEHNKCGLWLDGPFDSLFITGLTIRNTFADGINFHKGVTNSIVEQTIVRNVGDDALAMWAEAPNAYGKNIFRFNTLQLPILANTIAIYGGNDNSATDNLCIDTVVEGAGLQTGTRFASINLAGTTSFARNTLIRTGSGSMYDPSSRGFGQIWLYADSGSVSGVTFTDITMTDAYYQGIGFYQGVVNNMNFTNILIDTADYALEERTSGTIMAKGVVAKNIKVAGQWSCGTPLTIQDGGGNSGWDSKACK